MKEFIMNRLKERSTYVALLTIVGLFGVKLAPELKETIATGAAGVIAAIFALTPDQKPVTISKPSMDEIKAGVPELIKTVMQPDASPGKNLDP